jgi:hypothetical protein
MRLVSDGRAMPGEPQTIRCQLMSPALPGAAVESHRPVLDAYNPLCVDPATLRGPAMASRYQRRWPFRWLWLPVATGVVVCAILGGVISACGHPWSEYTDKPGRSPLFCGLVDGTIAAYQGGFLGLIAALILKAVARWCQPRRWRE